MKASLARMQAYLVYRRAQFEQEGKSVVLANCVYKEEKIQLDLIQLDDLYLAIPKLDDSKIKVQDPFLEVNLRDGSDYKPTFVSQLLKP